MKGDEWCLIQVEYAVVNVPVDELHEHPRNELYKTPLQEDEDEYRMMVASIRTDGLRHPLLVQQGTNTVISGHTRLRIVRSLGWAEVPVRYMDVDNEVAETMLVADNLERAGKERDLIKLARAMERLYARYTAESGRREALSQLSEVFAVQERQLDRHRSLLKLIRPLQTLVSEEHIGLKAGAALSALSTDEQEVLLDYLRELAKEKDWRLTESQAKMYINRVREVIEKSQQNSNEPTKPNLEEFVQQSGEDPSPSPNDIPPTASRELSELRNTAQRDLMIHEALTHLDRDKRAIERIKSQTVKDLESALKVGSPDVKKQLNSLKKSLRELNDTLKSLE